MIIVKGLYIELLLGIKREWMGHRWSRSGSRVRLFRNRSGNQTDYFSFRK